MSGKLVSVLTPSYNQAQWLGDNLRSVVMQTYPQIEHIVMDGGSTDGSVDILRGAASNVRWRSEPDRGQSHAVNKAFGESKGEIIGWLNSDDAYFSIDAVAAAVEAFDRTPGVGVVYGHAAMIDSAGTILRIIRVPSFDYPLLQHTCYIYQPAVFIRRSALWGHFLDENLHYAMDYDLWLRLGQAVRFQRIDKILAVDRNYPSRKVVAARREGVAESQEVRARYPVAKRQAARSLVWRVASRVLGAHDIARVNVGELAFCGRVDGLLPRLARQLILPRRLTLEK
jgi:glycosyltransferase involved in cell wall biosynthesis